MELQEELKKMMSSIQAEPGDGRSRKHRVSFEWHPVEDHDYLRETGVKRFKDEVYIRAYTPGSKSQTHRKVTDQDKKNFPKQWLTFLSMQGEDQQDGFPIHQWYACTNGQARTLMHNGIKTVEKLADTSYEQIKKFGQAYPDLRNAAIAHIEQSNGAADNNKLRAKIDQQNESIDSLNRKVKRLEKKITELKDANTS